MTSYLDALRQILTVGQLDEAHEIARAALSAPPVPTIDAGVKPSMPLPWEEGLSGNANVVHFDGDNIRGVAVVDNPRNRAYIIAACNERPALRVERDALDEEVCRLHEEVERLQSCVDFGWRWDVEELPCAACGRAGRHPDEFGEGDVGCGDCRGSGVRGWLVNTTFRRPDTETGVVGEGRGRQEYMAVGSTASSVVKTAWLLAELIVRHELMEAFMFVGEDGVARRVLDPHKTLDELCVLAACRRMAP